MTKTNWSVWGLINHSSLPSHSHCFKAWTLTSSAYNITVCPPFEIPSSPSLTPSISHHWSTLIRQVKEKLQLCFRVYHLRGFTKQLRVRVQLSSFVSLQFTGIWWTFLIWTLDSKSWKKNTKSTSRLQALSKSVKTYYQPTQQLWNAS